MKIDIGEILTRAWQITWKHRALWVYGSVLGLLISFMFPLMLIPMSFPFLMERFRTNLTLFPLVLGVFIILFFGFILAIYPISTLTQTALTLSILDIEQGDGKMHIVDAFKKALPYFWRVLGVMLLYAAGMTLFQLIIQGIVFLGGILTLGLGLICLTPVTILMYPLIYFAVVWMEQAVNGVLIDQLDVTNAVKRGWELIRNNLLSMGLIVIVIYFGIGLVSAFFIVPLMFPMFMIPFGFIGHGTNWVILFISIFCMVVLIPVFALLTGWSTAFAKSAWVLIYLRLNRPMDEPRPTLQEIVS